MKEQDRISDLIQAITRKLADTGKTIEGGWLAYLACDPKLGQLPPDELVKLRRAYYLGAHHLFASIMTMLDPDSEPTAQDIYRMTLIHQELEKFRNSLYN